MWQKICALIIKEFLALLKDKRGRMILIIPPIIQLFIFSQAATLDVKNVSVAIFNRDSGKPATELVQRLAGSPYLTRLTFLKNEGEIQEVIDTFQSVVVVHIDDQFSRNILSGNPANVQLILDGRKSNTTQIVAGYIARIVDQYNKDLATEGYAPKPTSRIIPRNWYNPNLIFDWFIVPALVATLSMVTSILVTALSVTREKELGTFEQLLVSPLTPLHILLGKTIPGLIIGMGEATLILIAALLFFDIPLTGPVWALYISLFVFILSNVGIGLFISSLCKTQQQSLLLSFIFISPAVTLSGLATPIENMPDWLQTLSLANPLRHFIFIVRGIFLKAMEPGLIFYHTIPLILIALIVLPASAWFFRRRLE